jgi:hypothetical protein
LLRKSKKKKNKIKTPRKRCFLLLLVNVSMMLPRSQLGRAGAGRAIGAAIFQKISLFFFFDLQVKILRFFFVQIFFSVVKTDQLDVEDNASSFRAIPKGKGYLCSDNRRARHKATSTIIFPSIFLSFLSPLFKFFYLQKVFFICNYFKR